MAVVAVVGAVLFEGVVSSAAQPADATPADARPVSATPASIAPRDALIPLLPIADLLGAPVCGLLQPGSESAASPGCLVCHGNLAHGGHPYDFMYPRAGSPSELLRPLAEVTRRGLSLPEGQVRCTTCHERGSPWKYHLKLPPGATPTHAVDLTRRVTYENPGALPPPRRGDDVGRKPLCLVCHALD
jgi:hypothetical protein